MIQMIEISICRSIYPIFKIYRELHSDVNGFSLLISFLKVFWPFPNILNRSNATEFNFLDFLSYILLRAISKFLSCRVVPMGAFNF